MMRGGGDWITRADAPCFEEKDRRGPAERMLDVAEPLLILHLPNGGALLVVQVETEN